MEKRLNFVCIDNSEQSQNAFDWYVKNYHQTKTDTVGLLFVHRSPVMSDVSSDSKNIDPQILNDYQKELDESNATAKGIEERFKVMCEEKLIQYKFILSNSQQSPGRVICNLTKEHGADAIFMGQRGLGHLSRSLLGSTSDYVLHHAVVPVMVIPKIKK